MFLFVWVWFASFVFFGVVGVGAFNVLVNASLFCVASLFCLCLYVLCVLFRVCLFCFVLPVLLRLRLFVGVIVLCVLFWFCCFGLFPLCLCVVDVFVC